MSNQILNESLGLMVERLADVADLKLILAHKHLDTAMSEEVDTLACLDAIKKALDDIENDIALIATFKEIFNYRPRIEV